MTSSPRLTADFFAAVVSDQQLYHHMVALAFQLVVVFDPIWISALLWCVRTGE